MTDEVSAAPQVSVIIPARDAGATIGRTLSAVQAQAFDGGYEVIVVDDGSRDETVAIAEAAGARVLRQAGRGPGEARNLGASHAAGSVLAFTDADCFPTVNWLREGVRALDGSDLVQGEVLPDPQAARGPYDHTIWVVRESGLYETANLLVRRELFLRVGGFEDWLDVEIGKRLGEDVWFGWKARRAGARTTFSSSALVHHAVFARRWYEFVAERRRLVYFPPLVRKIPELRRHFLRSGLFVTPRSAAFAGAVAGTVATGIALGVGARGRGLLPFAAAGPYLWINLRRVQTLGPRRGARVAAVEFAADALGFASIVRGSVRARTVVL